MIDDKRVIAVIPARAGSEGLPGKNLRPLLGRPMIDWTFAAAVGSALIDRTLVTSDDQAVLDLAQGAGLEAIRRPDELAGPQASVIDAIAHALAAAEARPDYVVLLQPTSPLRRASDIDGAIELLHRRGAPAVLGVSPMLKPHHFHKDLRDGALHPLAEPVGEPVVLNGAVYVARVEALFDARSFQSPGALGFSIPPERAVDVDTLYDFLLVEALALAEVRGEPIASVRR